MWTLAKRIPKTLAYFVIAWWGSKYSVAEPTTVVPDMTVVDVMKWMENQP